MRQVIPATGNEIPAALFASFTLYVAPRRFPPGPPVPTYEVEQSDIMLEVGMSGIFAPLDRYVNSSAKNVRRQLV
jgi:hypothetical protein